MLPVVAFSSGQVMLGRHTWVIDGKDKTVLHLIPFWYFGVKAFNVQLVRL